MGTFCYALAGRPLLGCTHEDTLNLSKPGDCLDLGVCMGGVISNRVVEQDQAGKRKGNDSIGVLQQQLRVKQSWGFMGRMASLKICLLRS